MYDVRHLYNEVQTSLSCCSVKSGVANWPVKWGKGSHFNGKLLCFQSSVLR